MPTLQSTVTLRISKPYFCNISKYLINPTQRHYLVTNAINMSSVLWNLFWWFLWPFQPLRVYKCHQSCSWYFLSLHKIPEWFYYSHAIYRRVSYIEICFQWPFYWHGLTLIPAWISIYLHYKVWDEITYPSHESTIMYSINTPVAPFTNMVKLQPQHG